MGGKGFQTKVAVRKPVIYLFFGGRNLGELAKE
jgi:hypothetical protein